MIRLYLDMKTLFETSGIVIVYSKSAYCVCCLPFIVVSHSFLVYVPDSIKSVCMRQGDKFLLKIVEMRRQVGRSNMLTGFVVVLC